MGTKRTTSRSSRSSDTDGEWSPERPRQKARVARQGPRAAAPRPSQGAAARQTASQATHGVIWSPSAKRWIATLRCRGSYMFLGSFRDEAEAARRHDLAALAMLGRNAAPLNMPAETYYDAHGSLPPMARLRKMLDLYQRVSATNSVSAAHRRVAASLPVVWRPRRSSAAAGQAAAPAVPVAPPPAAAAAAAPARALPAVAVPALQRALGTGAGGGGAAVGALAVPAPAPMALQPFAAQAALALAPAAVLPMAAPAAAQPVAPAAAPSAPTAAAGACPPQPWPPAALPAFSPYAFAAEHAAAAAAAASSAAWDLQPPPCAHGAGALAPCGADDAPAALSPWYSDVSTTLDIGDMGELLANQVQSLAEYCACGGDECDVLELIGEL